MRKNRRTKIYMLVVGVVFVFAVLFILSRWLTTFGPQPTGIPQISRTPAASPKPLPAKIMQNVPFAAQAPFGDWDDPRQQDGCEEASVIMAMRWVKGESLTKDDMLQEIFKLAVWGEQKFGTYHDTSVEDTLKFITEYYGYPNAKAYYGITVEDIKRELKDGKIVLVPVNGQLLGNPYYTEPGPEYHFLVIVGYDDNKGVFITNDPGTRQGESYTYAYERLFDALRHYPTGFHLPVPTNIKAMIVVSK